MPSHPARHSYHTEMRIDRLSASINGGAFEIRIREYVAHVCTAIHAGHRLREELEPKCALNEHERLYEEDPFTGRLIEN